MFLCSLRIVSLNKVLVMLKPDGSGEVNELAIAHYNNVIDDILDRGLRHWTLVFFIKFSF